MRLKHLGYLGLLALIGVAGCEIATANTFAAVTCPPGSLREQAGEPADSLAECNLPVPGKDDKTLMQTLTQILDVVVGVVGVVAVAVIIIGGIYFVISQGDPAKVTRARNTILYGVVGLVVAMLAFAIVHFVLGSIFGGAQTSTGGSGGQSGGSGGADNP